MKWGGRKPSPSPSPSSSKPSFISPFSWLSKFKQMRINSEPKPGTVKQNAKQNSTPFDSSPHYASGNNRGRFYGGDDEAFWRLSFGEEGNEQKKSEDILKPVKYNVDAEHVTPSSSFLNAKRQGRKEGTQKLKEKETGMRKEKKLLNEAAKSVKELESLRRRYERKAQKVLQEQLLKLEKAEEEAEFSSSQLLENDVLQFESPRTICTPKRQFFVDSKNSGLGNLREALVSSPQLGSEWHSVKLTEELKLKAKSSSNKQRQTLHVSRENQRRKAKQNTKVKVYSPRMGSKVEVRKIKAIEEKKKAKLKMKKEEEIVEESSGLDSFAVVKCSLDPQKDFRDSMIEMITEKQINGPEEMEDLLACYLTLNSSEYHDLIIDVFRQVWLYISPASLGIQSDKQCCCCD